jgi:DNA-directed RNA polymerase I, II, and III subunit RPABC3
MFYGEGGERKRSTNGNSKCFTSFGGLLMALEGPYKKLTPLRVDYVYMLLKR